jgi:hypothetical protein
MTLFDRNLYFSTFLEGQAGSCKLGDATIYGEDYLVPANTSDLTKGGKLAPPDSSGGTYPKVFNEAIVAGVGLRQLPSCSSSTTVGASSDDFLGYGQMMQTTNTVPGGFQLTFFKGSTSTSSPPGVQTVDLRPPLTPARISSWAPIVE